MFLSRIVTPLMAALFLTACGGSASKEDQALLDEAGKIHLEASAIQEEVEPELTVLDSLRNQLTTRRAALKDTVAATAALAQINSVMASMEEWEENAVEVPGVEHKHDHAEGEGHHHHEHKKAPDVTATQMLDIQKEIKKNIERIRTDVREAKDKAMAALQ
jgi:SMC interacting uncharacterized protein involved in chromosome segregation